MEYEKRTIMLTDLEARILDFVTRHITQYGTAPKITEIGIAVDIRSKGTVHRYLQSLIRKGYLQSIKGQQRGLRLPGGMPESDSFSLPLVGRIAAGRPIEAVSGLDSINLNQLFVRPGRFLIKVSGNSMRDAGILDGDFVVVEKKRWQRPETSWWLSLTRPKSLSNISGGVRMTESNCVRRIRNSLPKSTMLNVSLSRASWSVTCGFIRSRFETMTPA